MNHTSNIHNYFQIPWAHWGEGFGEQVVSLPEGVDLWLELQPQPQLQDHMIGASVSMTTAGPNDIKIPRMKRQLQKGVQMENELP